MIRQEIVDRLEEFRKNIVLYPLNKERAQKYMKSYRLLFPTTMSQKKNYGILKTQEPVKCFT